MWNSRRILSTSRATIVVASSALFLGAMTLGAAAQDTKLLRWFTTAGTSTNHIAALQLAQAINAASSAVRITVHDSTGGIENIRRLQAGTTELINITTDLAYDAAEGAGLYKGKPYSKIRNVLTAQMLTYTIVVRASSGITSLEQLAGKKFSPGFTGSSSTIIVMRELELLGIKPDYVPLSLRDAIDGMKDGRIVGFAKGSAIPDANLMEIATDGPIRLLQPTREQLNDLATKMPGTTMVTQKIEGGLYAGNDKDFEYSQVGFGLFLGASSDLPQAVSYVLAKTAISNWQKALQGVKGFASGDPVGLSVADTGTPLAAGTVQYLKERGINVPAKLIPPEYKDIKN